MVFEALEAASRTLMLLVFNLIAEGNYQVNPLLHSHLSTRWAAYKVIE